MTTLLTYSILILAAAAPVLLALDLSLHRQLAAERRHIAALLDGIARAERAAEIAQWQRYQAYDLILILVIATPELVWRAGYHQALLDLSEARQLEAREVAG